MEIIIVIQKLFIFAVVLFLLRFNIFCFSLLRIQEGIDKDTYAKYLNVCTYVSYLFVDVRDIQKVILVSDSSCN